MLCACVQGGHKKLRCRKITMLESIADSAAMMKEQANPFPLKINVKCSDGMCGNRVGICTTPIVMTGFQVQLLTVLGSIR